ncbi:MAG: ATP-binding protein [Dermatophilaceae bacterium]
MRKPLQSGTTEVLLVEEVTGRDRSALATRRTAAGFPTGKTFLLEALGQHAVEHGMRVAWFTLEDLGGLLRRHRADETVTKAITRILRADLVVVDDIGPLAVASDAAEGLYRLVDAAYKKRSIALSSNLHPAAFDELMPKTLATVLLGWISVLQH